MGYRYAFHQNHRPTGKGPCALCGKIFAPYEPGLEMVPFIADGQEKIVYFCHHHILEMVRKNDTYLEEPEMPGHFNLRDYLNKVEESLKIKNPNNRRAVKTAEVLKKFLDKAGLSGLNFDPKKILGSEYR